MKDRAVKFAIDLTWIYKYNISSRARRDVRVVEGATLEKSCAARHLGFESLTLRQPEKPVLPASLFYSRFPIPKPASIASAEITFELYSRCA